MLIQDLLRTPDQIWSPAIANIMKKNTNIRIVSLSKGTAESNADTSILNPSIPEIVLRGLITLNDLSTLRLTELLVIINGMYPLITIIKSSMFQESLKYESFGNINPSPSIFRIISIEYRIKKM